MLLNRKRENKGMKRMNSLPLSLLSLVVAVFPVRLGKK